jgi:hypothetical protein
MKAEKVEEYSGRKATRNCADKGTNVVRIPTQLSKKGVVTLEDKWSLDCGPDVLRLVD